jgi:hypothetical protein
MMPLYAPRAQKYKLFLESNVGPSVLPQVLSLATNSAAIVSTFVGAGAAAGESASDFPLVEGCWVHAVMTRAAAIRERSIFFMDEISEDEFGSKPNGSLGVRRADDAELRVAENLAGRPVVGVVERIERLQTDLQVCPLRQPRVLEQRRVELHDSRNAHVRYGTGCQT